MVSNRTKYIGTVTTSTLIAVLLWFSLSYHFDFELSGDVACSGTFEDPCEASYNITLTNPLINPFYIRNKESVNLIFIPNVKASYSCKKDGRYRFEKHKDREQHPCGLGWREFTWKDPLTSRYQYIEKFTRGKKHEYKLVVFKFNPSDTIKWGGKITGEEVDPKFLPTYNTIKICDIKTTEKEVLILHENKINRVTFEKYTSYDEKVCSDEPTNLTCSIETFNGNFTKRVIKEYRFNVTVGSYIEFKNKSVNCRVKTLFVKDLIVECPNGYRCDRIKNELCLVRLADGSKNLNAKENDGRGFDSTCLKISELKEGCVKISDYKDICLEIKKK